LGVKLLGQLEVTVEPAGCERFGEYLSTVERGERDGLGR